MSKRLSRYSGNKIETIIPSLSGKWINVILNDSTVYFVVVLDQKEGKLKVKNMVNHKYSIPIKEISEIIMDEDHK